MTDHRLSDLLTVAADRVEPAPPPIDAMYGAARKVRRRRRWVAGSLAVAAVVVVIGTAAAFDNPEKPIPPTPADTPNDPAVPPPGMRLVGLDHAAIAVPDSWGTNETRCGTPQKDTVIINVGGTETCAASRPRNVDSVEISQGPSHFDQVSPERITIDAVDAERQPTACELGASGGPTVCSGAVFVLPFKVWFRAESSTSARVDEILDQIRVVPRRVGIPEYATTFIDAQERSGARYLTQLEGLGFEVQQVTKPKAGLDPGFVLGVSPAVGTMVEPGSTVTVTVSR